MTQKLASVLFLLRKLKQKGWGQSSQRKHCSDLAVVETAAEEVS